MRLNYPSSVRIIRVPCTGKVDVQHILRCFERGADGVYVVGCREGDCHYQSGNFRAKKRVEQAQQLLDRIGVGGQRVRMCNLSSSDAPLFVRFAEEMHAAVLSAGPSPIRIARASMKTHSEGIQLQSHP
jgi:F420-non-reducing hydrogenase iron-sulfur subunit